MSQSDYLRRIATARSTRPATTAQDAYAQVDRMARSTNVVRTEEGLIVPIDAIPVRLDGRALEILGR